MKVLKERILSDGIVKEGNILKVDSFLNHQIDTELMDAMADEYLKRFSGKTINKVLTIETSGIALAFAVARKLRVPLVYARKTDSVNLHGDVYSTKVVSYTHFREYDVIVSKKYLNEDDRILILDDFLANGCALKGLLSLVEQSGGKVEGIGIAIEKSFQKGSSEIRNQGHQLESLARISKIDAATNTIEFVN